jgi:tetratricopeptide (TPR) repeat protein
MQTSPQDPRWTSRMAALLQQVQDYPGAIRLYSESLKTQHDAAVVANLAECHRLDGNPAAAMLVWNEALHRYPADPALRLAYGRMLYSQGSFREALSQYERGSQLDPLSDLFHNRRALCHFQLGELDSAVNAARQALAIRERAVYYYNLAIATEELGEYGQAEEFYRSGLARFPGDQMLERGYGEFLDARGRRGEAISLLSSAVAGNGGALDFANLAGIAEEQGDLDAAADAWRAALSTDPSSVWLLTAASSFWARIGNIEALVEHVRVARNRMEPFEFAELLRETGQAFLGNRTYHKGVEAFGSILADHPGVPMVYNQLGLLQHMAGDTAAGLATVRRGLQDVNQTTLGRYLEVFLTARLSGTAAALDLGSGMVADPEADYAAFELYAGLLLDAGRFEDAERVASACKDFLAGGSSCSFRLAHCSARDDCRTQPHCFPAASMRGLSLVARRGCWGTFSWTWEAILEP